VLEAQGGQVERAWSHRHALTLWLEHALYHGQAARGAVFRKSYRDLGAISAACETMFPNHGATLSPEDRTWRFRNGATLKLRGLASVEDAWEHAGHAYTMLIFDAAPEWQDDARPLQYMLSTLRSAHDVPTRCITIGEMAGRVSGR